MFDFFSLASDSRYLQSWALKNYREEKSLRHIAMVAKFLNDNKPKIHLKENSPYFKLHRPYSISFNLSNVGGISGVESKRIVP